jgi:glycosyltransferase involved in cell wall biosynthesis
MEHECEPLVSICIPTYNGAEHLRETINCVLEQTYQNFELIINDDCSKDATVQVVQSYQDPRIRFSVNEENQGLVGNSNRVLSRAGGVYIKLLMQDDVFDREEIALQVKAMEAHPNVSIVVAASKVLNPRGKEVMRRRLYKQDTIIPGSIFSRQSIQKARNWYGEPSVQLFRASAVQEAGLFDAGLFMTMDWDFALRMSHLGDVYYISKCLNYFRISGTSISSKAYREKREQILNEFARFFKKHQNVFGMTEADFNRYMAKIKRDMFLKNIFIAVVRKW